MKKVLIFTLIVFCCLGAFGQTKKNPKKSKGKRAVTTPSQTKTEITVSVSSKITAEEYSVYMTVLGKDSEIFIVKDKSRVDDFGGVVSDFFEQSFEDLKTETIKDFKLKNKESSKLEKKFPTKNNYVLISDEELNKFFDKESNREEFHKKYPESGGFSTFSRVGFSKDGKQALVFTAFFCQGLCGQGNYHFLKNENGEWIVIKTQVTWIS